jgi:hypothetical protein
VVIAGAGVATAATAPTVSTTVTRASADTYLHAKSPTQSHGGSVRIVAKRAESTTLVRFTVPTRPAGASVKATLVLTRSAVSQPSKLLVKQVATTWNERSVTYRTPPRFGGDVGSVSDNGRSATTRIDVSRAVGNGGTIALGVFQTTTTAGGALFKTRETGAAGTARLEVTYRTAAAPTPAPSTPAPAPSTPAPAPSTPAPSPSASAPAQCTVSAILVPSCGVWWGATANPLATESWDTALGNLESQMGRPFDIAHYYNASPKLFPTAAMIARAREPGKNRILLLNWKPEMGRTWAQVAAGDAVVDKAIDDQAAYLKKNFTEKFFLVVHHEPEDEIKPAAGSGYTAKDYAAMNRYVVKRLRAGGVTNAVTVMNYMGTPHWGSQSWFADLYPGDDVVDWIAYDPYIFGSAPNWWQSFSSVLNRTDTYTYPNWPGFYNWATQKHPSKPLMLAEWGVNEQTGAGLTKASIFQGIPAALKTHPRLKALVYWNQNDFNPVGTTRFDSSPSALAAARALGTGTAVTKPFYLK